MVTITSHYSGGLRCTATHGPSGVTLITDAPVDNHGKGESFSPTDLVATAVANCMMTVMAIAAERHGIDLKGTSVTIGKEMSADLPRRIVSSGSGDLTRIPGKGGGVEGGWNLKRFLKPLFPEACRLDSPVERTPQVTL